MKLIKPLMLSHWNTIPKKQTYLTICFNCCRVVGVTSLQVALGLIKLEKRSETEENISVVRSKQINKLLIKTFFVKLASLAVAAPKNLEISVCSTQFKCLTS